MKPARLDLAVSGLVALLVLGPLLVGPGYWLFGDMVFVPRQPWKDAWLGLDGSLPRAVPMDAVVSVLTQVVPGSWVQKTFLVTAFVVGGLGTGRLVRPYAGLAAARVAAILLYLWNPWVHERLLLGQWAILAGYLALPWVALAARRLRRDLRAGWAPAAVVLVVSAVCSPSSGVMAVVVLVVLGVRWRAWRSWAVVAGLGLLANLTWLVPSLVADASDTAAVTTDGVFDLFAARAESSAGVLASLLSLGGTWKTSILAPERTSAVVVLLSCLLTLAALAGLRRAARTGDRSEVRRLLALAAAALVVAALPTALTGGGGADLLEWLGDRVPAAALLRDSQRFLGPAALALAVGVAAAVTWVREQVAPGREALWAVVGLAVVAPVVLLPSLAWGGGELARSTYPDDWAAVADLVAAEPGTTVVLPWDGSYRRFAFNDGRAVLDPAPRLLPGLVLVDDRTLVDGRAVPSEDPRVAAVTTALAAGTPDEVRAALRGLGVRWVLLEPGADRDGPDPVPTGRTAYDGGTLRLLDLGPGPDSPSAPSDGPSGTRSSVLTSHGDHGLLVIVGHGCVFVLLLCGLMRILHSGVTTVTSSRRWPLKSLGGD